MNEGSILVFLSKCVLVGDFGLPTASLRYGVPGCATILSDYATTLQVA
jgi:hypothetical protein